MRKLASLLISGLVAITTAKATLAVLIPAQGATAVCVDRRFVGTGGEQFDADDKLQLLPPHAAYFVVGLEAISTRERVLYSPGAIFRDFLAERAAQGIPPDIAIRDSDKVAQSLREAFEKLLRDRTLSQPKQNVFEIEPAFTLGILLTEHHVPHLTTITVARNPKKPATVTSHVAHGMERFGVDAQWPGSIFSRSDPMYAGQFEVIRGLLEHKGQLSRFTTDPYVKKFLLADFGMPLTDAETAVNAARRLISVTAEGLSTLPDSVPGVSKESVCAVLDYASETVRYK